MSQRPGTDENLSNQPISQKPHSEEEFEDRGTTDTIGPGSGNAPRPADAEQGRLTTDRDSVESRARERAETDEPGGKRAAQVAGAGTAMFFPVVILTLIAAALIIYLLFFR